jgi:hypothetical protein
MFTPLLLALAATPQPGPALPPMTSERFQDLVIAIEEKMAAGDFAAAGKMAIELPKPAFTIGYDNRKLPAELRDAFHIAGGRAVGSWHIRGVLPDDKPDVKIAFAPVLADDPQSGVPANVVTIFSSDPASPRMTAVIGLRRGKPLRDTTPGDVYNDVRYAVGAYIGLARTPALPGYAMYGGPGNDDPRLLGAPELRSANQAFGVSQQIRRAIDARLPLAPSGRAEVSVSPAGFESTAIQGDQVDLEVQLTNKGTGTLTIDAVGDCGCVVPLSGPAVAPNHSGTLRVRIDTKEFSAAIDRKVIVFTNDPKQPTFVIPAHIQISPRYRILVPEGLNWVVDEGGKSADAYFTFPHGAEMTIIDARMVGIDGATVKYEPWTGTLPDPEFKEGPQTRHGYHLRITVPNRTLPGRSPVSLLISTADSEFPRVYQTINLQHGIVSLPQEIFLGNVGNRPQTASVILTRPGRPFKVLSASSNVKSFSVTVVPGDKDDEVRLEVRYDGHGSMGAISGEIVVTTDDPKQPTVSVPLSASVQ